MVAPSAVRIVSVKPHALDTPKEQGFLLTVGWQSTMMSQRLGGVGRLWRDWLASLPIGAGLRRARIGLHGPL